MGTSVKGGRELSVESREQPDGTPSQPYMFVSIYPSDYHSSIFDWLLLVQMMIIMMVQHVNFYFQSILGIFMLQGDSFSFSTSPGHVICFPHLHLLKLLEVWELPGPVCSICLPGCHVPFFYLARTSMGRNTGGTKSRPKLGSDLGLPGLRPGREGCSIRDRPNRDHTVLSWLGWL